MKILIIGPGESGKDTVAEALTELGYSYESSSHAAARIFLFEKLKSKYGYQTFEDCYNDRRNHRAEWYNEIRNYNREDRARLAKEILKDNEIYCGMRDAEEIEACRDIFNLIIWVERPGKTEGKDSFNIDPSLADVILYNQTTVEELKRTAKCLVDGYSKL